MERLWPDLKGKRVVLDAASSWAYDDGYTEEDNEWFRKKAEEVERERRAGFRPGDVVIVKGLVPGSKVLSPGQQ